MPFNIHYHYRYTCFYIHPLILCSVFLWMVVCVFCNLLNVLWFIFLLLVIRKAHNLFFVLCDATFRTNGYSVWGRRCRGCQRGWSTDCWVTCTELQGTHHSTALPWPFSQASPLQIDLPHQDRCFHVIPIEMSRAQEPLTEVAGAAASQVRNVSD